MAVVGNIFYITFTVGSGGLVVFWKTIGTGTWQQQQLGYYDFSYLPAITADGNTVDIVAPDGDGDLQLYSAAEGSYFFHTQTVAKSVLIVAPSIAVNDGALTITAVGGPEAHSPLMFYWAAKGSSTWHAETVASGANYTSGPSITSNDNAANISDVNSAGDLEFYWAADGTSTWHAELIPGNGTGPHA